MPHLDIGFTCCAPVPHMNHPVLKFSCLWFSHVMLCVSFLSTVLGLQDRELEFDTLMKVSDTLYYHRNPFLDVHPVLTHEINVEKYQFRWLSHW
jgi:hypothetical protein